jgi:hypothetical protein
LLDNGKNFAHCLDGRVGAPDYDSGRVTPKLLLETTKQFRLSRPLARPRIVVSIQWGIPHREWRTPEDWFSRTKQRRMMMQPARATRSAAVSTDTMRERWLAGSLLAVSLALVAWCVVAL